MKNESVRIEKDSLGEVRVPVDALYMAQTQRAIENFPVSGLRFGRSFIRTLGIIKAAAAKVNAELGLLDAALAAAIEQAATEVAEGRHDEWFAVDIFQTGSGTSTNMNANEVIATRAQQIIGRNSRSSQRSRQHVPVIQRCDSSGDPRGRDDGIAGEAPAIAASFTQRADAPSASKRRRHQNRADPSHGCDANPAEPADRRLGGTDTPVHRSPDGNTCRV